MDSVQTSSRKPVALITGAAGGIGSALVRAFCGAGYDVIALDVAVPGFEQIARQYLKLDLAVFVSSPAQEREGLAEILRTLGERPLDVLVNNAAVQVLGGVEELGLEGWRRTLDVNLLAPFRLTQGLLTQLSAAQGCVINISSIHAQLTKPGFVAYATSKAALSGMTRAMAVDLGGRVRVNAIEPAAIATDMLKAGFAERPDEFERLEACHPQGRIGSPDEVAALAVSIASGSLRFLHGACIGMNGGLGGRLHDPV